MKKLFVGLALALSLGSIAFAETQKSPAVAPAAPAAAAPAGATTAAPAAMQAVPAQAAAPAAKPADDGNRFPFFSFFVDGQDSGVSCYYVTKP